MVNSYNSPYTNLLIVKREFRSMLCVISESFVVSGLFYG